MGPTPNDRKDPRDANPMFKRLPAEIVSRRKKQEPTVSAEDEEVLLDRKAVFVLKPELRLKWLVKALRQAAEGRLPPNDLYDVVASSRFVENLTPKVGRKMGRALFEQIGLFTPKQQKWLKEQAEIVTRFGVVQEAQAREEEEEDKKSSAKAKAMDEMMARVNAFVSEKQRESARGDGTAALPAPELARVADGAGGIADAARHSHDDSSAKDDKKDKDKAEKAKSEKKKSKDSKAKAKNGANGKARHSSSSSSSSRRSRSKSRGRKKDKDEKGSKKASSGNSKKASSKKRSESKSRSSSSSSSEERKRKHSDKHSDKKKRRTRSSSSSSSSSDSSGKRRKRKKTRH